jgi:tetratricopeptide (TPR) repeat protein
MRSTSILSFSSLRAAHARLLLGIALGTSALAVPGCGDAARGPATAHDVARARDAKNSDDSEEVGSWALLELLAPGGDAKQAEQAISRLQKFAPGKREGMLANLALGMYSEDHGDPAAAAQAYALTARAAAASPDASAPLVGWFAAVHLTALRGSVPNLFTTVRPILDPVLRSPRNVGWRAHATLLEWNVSEDLDRPQAANSGGGAASSTPATAGVTGVEATMAPRLGCLKGLRLAGPFGVGSAPDRRRSFAAEQPGRWPLAWAKEPVRGLTPKVLKSEQPRCMVASKERTADGVFYAEGFLSTDADRDVILTAQGALKVWIDDLPVLERDLREFGVWQRFGAAVHLPKGRHRVVVRLLGDSTTVRVVNLDGTPAAVTAGTDDGSPYGLTPPEKLRDPNPIDAYVRGADLPSPIVRFLAASAAHAEGLNDVASWLLDPLVKAGDAAASTLEMAAVFGSSDAAVADDARRRNARALHTKAKERDPGLWYSRAWLILDDAEQRGLIEAVAPMRELAAQFPKRSEIGEQLVRVYGRLGWKAERYATLKDLVARFPDSISIQKLWLEVLEEEGPLSEADKVAQRLKALDPDSEVDLTRALARLDYPAALAELRRLEARRPDRKDIAGRIADVLQRSGDPRAAIDELAKALAKNPQDSDLRLKVADREYAGGDKSALRRALAAAIATGAKGKEIREAIELLEGATTLEGYRIDGRKVIRDFEAWEKTGKRMEGSAARVLDYSTLWVQSDGSSLMLEHEIVRVQSQEGIAREAEQNQPDGLVLRFRVIKPNGQILEPEQVAGKPTMTMPHLEVGDYIETEHITENGSEAMGERYRGPTWFFREADKGYWRSEFIVVSPKNKELLVETRGNVPPPTLKDRGPFNERRWRVDESPPSIVEPGSPPAVEYLPSVRVGWGISFDNALRRIVDSASEETPLDPRLRTQAEDIVRNVPKGAIDERARRVYREVLSKIEEGKDTDGRRVLSSKSGSRQAAFIYLLKQLGIPVELAIVRGRLAMPSQGPMSEVDAWDSLALRIETEKGPRWLTVRDKFAPYGYLPADLRGQPAVRLVEGLPRDTTSKDGTTDGLMIEGRGDLRADGSATVNLVQSFTGKLAIQMRNVLERIPEAQLSDFVETRLIGNNMPGARVREVKVENREDLDGPVRLKIRAEAPQLGRPQGGDLALRPVFPLQIAQLVSLPQRQTPLLLGTSSHVEVRFEVVIPEGMRAPASLPHGEARDGERYVIVKDSVRGRAITLDRVADLPAGRVQPGADYTKFTQFAEKGDTLFESEILLGR